MSSNGPYKSRLFNFINRQAIEVNSRLGKTFRHLKVAATWGVQILLYPFYLLVQTGRWAERQIGQKFEEIKYKLPTFNQENLSEETKTVTDEVISNVLEEVQISLLTDVSSELNKENIFNQEDKEVEKIEHKSLVKIEKDNYIPVLQENQKIRGIASLLATKSLVLVTKNNEIIDILNSKQQKKIEQLIIWAIAEYWIFYRNKIKKLRSSLPLITSNNSHVIIPIRLFWQVMGWLQISAVARGVNLFGESSLTVNSNYPDKKLALNRFLINDFIKINHLENNSRNLAQASSNQAELSTNHNLFLNNQQLFNIFKSDNLAIQEDDPFKIEVLIWAAVDYFFGDKNKHKKNKLPETNSELVEIDSDPWLSWEDLSKPKIETDSLKNQEEKSLNLLECENLPKIENLSASKINKKIINSNKNKNKNKIIQSLPRKKTLEKSINKINKINKKSSNNNKKQQDLSLVNFDNNHQQSKIVNQKENNNYEQNLEAKPDWLETEATPIGYVKNPLEIILEWLDKIILFIEEISIIVIKFVKRVFAKNQ